MDRTPRDLDIDRHPDSGRRSLLKGAAALAAFAAISSSSATARALGDEHPTHDSGGPLTFDAFLALANPLAAKLVKDTSREGQDRYLFALAALAVRLTDVPVPEMREHGQSTVGKTYIGANEGGETFNVLHWRMEPNTMIGDHPHTYGNVVTLVLDGEVVVRNFEVVGERDFDTKGAFRVRKTCESVLTPGGINLVSLERNYMHGFRAGVHGARGLDITTRILPKRGAQSLELGAKPIDETLGVYHARWKS